MAHNFLFPFQNQYAKIVFLCITAMVCCTQSALPQVDFLEESLKLHSHGLQGNYLKMVYLKKNSYVSHSMNPGDKGSNYKKGVVHINESFFQKTDTLFAQNGKTYHSKIVFNPNELHQLKYGQEQFSAITKDYFKSFIVKTLSYSPMVMLRYFNERKHLDSLVQQETTERIVYSHQIHEYQVTLIINKKNYHVEKITTFYDIEEDDQFYGFGDITDVYQYQEYLKIGGCSIPNQVVKTELNGRLVDSVHVQKAEIVNTLSNRVKTPEFLLVKNTDEVPDISIAQYSENIHLINLHHCGTRSLLVEFKDFLLVADAPLNSKYGEQLLAEVRKINPQKPIRYFVFGHFHPHYTGGIRPFILEGAKVICVAEDKSYIESIADATFTLKPDRLAMSPKNVQFELIHQAKTISDGSFFMTIYHIGGKSNHTNDYLMFYFPKEKMIFEDDLIWIDEGTNASNVSAMTRGFYRAVTDLNLAVDEIVQNWHVFDRSNRMIFKFESLQKLFKNE